MSATAHAIAAERLAVGDLRGALVQFGRHEGPGLLWDWWLAGLTKTPGLKIDDDQLRSVLLDVWQRPEFPCRNLPRHIWLNWFRNAGYLTDIDRAKPTAPTLLYRAQVGRTMGLSWTPHRSHAEKFHTRNLRLSWESTVLEREIPPRAILATLSDGRLRNGQRAIEFIVDPEVRK